MAISGIRESEYPLLDEQRHVYLDYTGANLVPQSLLQAHQQQLATTVLGNPHSSNPTSCMATSITEEAREEILSFFNADPLKYCVVFTPNASGALKLVGESYPFKRGTTLAMLQDNHNSVNGMREYAKRAGATVTYLPLTDELRIRNDMLDKLARFKGRKGGLFVYPAQSNFSGVKHGLGYVKLVQALGYDVFLDASAYVPSSRLDIGKIKPDFVCASFYKMFGYPTGIGCLIAKREKLNKLKRPWFAGGTVQYVSVGLGSHLLEKNEARFEDGTINFLMTGAVKEGLRYMENLGMENIERHVEKMTRKLVSGMRALRYNNGRSMVKFYGPSDMKHRGGTVNFDLTDRRGKKVDARLVEKEANALGISLRTGCFCNPGAAERAYGMGGMERCLKKLGDRFDMEKFEHCLGWYVGSVRVSVGIATVEGDIEKFLEFLEGLGDRVGRNETSSDVSQEEKGEDRMESFIRERREEPLFQLWQAGT